NPSIELIRCCEQFAKRLGKLGTWSEALRHRIFNAGIRKAAAVRKICRKRHRNLLRSRIADRNASKQFREGNDSRKVEDTLAVELAGGPEKKAQQTRDDVANPA